MKKRVWIAGIAVLMAGVAQAALVQWSNGGANNWTETARWDSGALPGATEADIARFGGTDTAFVTTAIGAGNGISIDVRNASAAAALSIAANMTLIDIASSGANNGSSIQQSAGTVTVSGGVSLGTSGSSSTYNLTGGTLALTQTGNNDTLVVGANGTFVVSGNGALTTVGNVNVLAGGTVSLSGAGASMTIVGANRDFDLNGTSTLDFKLGAAGIGSITVGDIFTVDSTDSQLIIDGTAYTGGIADITLVNAADSMIGTFADGNITVTGLGEKGTGWNLTQGTNGDVVLNVIPEPATLGLVVAFGGGLVFVRRFMQM